MAPKLKLPGVIENVDEELESTLLIGMGSHIDNDGQMQIPDGHRLHSD